MNWKNEGYESTTNEFGSRCLRWNLFFYTSKSQSKIYEIEKERDVCISFSSPSDSTYVSLTGKARISDDQDLIDKYWSTGVAAWFKNGKDDSDVAILKVKISRGEHWNSKNNKLVQLFEMAKSNAIESSTPNLGENEEFGTE